MVALVNFASIGIGLIYIIFKLYQRCQKLPGFPPGPPMIPFIGSVALLGKNPLKTFKAMRSNYGEIVGMKIGGFRFVVLNNIQLVKEAFNQTTFSGLPVPHAFHTNGKIGTISFQGKGFLEQTKFAKRNLRDLAFSTETEALAQESCTDLIQMLRTKCGQPIHLASFLALPALKSLLQLIIGKRLDFSDPKLHDMCNKMAKMLRAGIIPYTFSTITQKLSELNQAQGILKDLLRTFKESIDEHKETYQEDDLMDYVDLYLHKIYSTTNSDSSFYKGTGELNLRIWVTILLENGPQGISILAGWAFYYLTQNLNSQKKLQQEIDSVLGKFRFPRLDDMEIMPYAAAVVLEVFRMGSIIPLGFPHATMEDVVFHGFKIPKGTAIIPNFYGFHYDENVWGDPEIFRPERFLMTDEKQIQNGHPEVNIFGVGRRSCPGQHIVRNHLFLLLINLFQNFTIRAETYTKSIPCTNTFQLIRYSPDIKYIFENRDSALFDSLI